jgi:pyruvate formate lyase activating enzyme
VPMWVRTPIIPGFTDDEENIAALAAFIRERLPNVERWDLLAFNNLGRPKYTRLGLSYPLDGAELITGEHMERLHTLAAAAVGEVARWSGATRL